LTSIFGGFVAYGVSFSPGPYAPWKIIYLLLGGLAIIVGFVVLLFLPDSPVTARFLTEEERIAALERVRDDQGGTHNKSFKPYQVGEAVRDPRTWMIVLVTMLTSIPNGALSNFSNIIIKNFGYSSQQALILSTPGGLVGAVTTVLCGYFSDVRGDRMMPIVGAVVPTIVGAAILVGASNSGNKGLLLFAIYLVQTFGSALSVIYAWNASNTSGHTKKVTINAMTLVSFAVRVTFLSLTYAHMLTFCRSGTSSARKSSSLAMPHSTFPAKQPSSSCSALPSPFASSCGC
jgi:MFS family permease